MRACLLWLLFMPLALWAEEAPVRLHAPEALRETGLVQHILPRFTLKTQQRVVLVPDTQAELVLGDAGIPLFEGPDAVWHLEIRGSGEGVSRLANWLQSEIGLRTILGFEPEGAALFRAPRTVALPETPTALAGDAEAGREVAQAACARCHAVDAAGRKNDIGSTPSFFVLRARDDWQARFETFYVRAPHGAFTQIAGVTEPFAANRPPPIVPLELTPEDVEAIAAYAATLPAADLGAPIRSQ